MKITKYTNVEKTKVELDGVKDVDMRLLISEKDGAEHFRMRMFEVQPGGHTPLHSHPFEHEVFVVEGTGVFVFEGKEHSIEPGFVIFVPGNREHCFRNTGDIVLKFLCLIPVG